MTFLECILESGRRAGIRDEDIRAALDQARMEWPNVNVNREIPPEQVGVVLDGMVEFHLALRADPSLGRQVQRQVRKKCRENAARN